MRTRLPTFLSALLCKLVWALAAVLVGPISANADSSQMPAKLPPAYVQECAACHVAYPPGMLPARSWQRIMGGLSDHYGTDASLDEAMLRQLDAWLQAHAGTPKRATQGPAQDRITHSAWFERKHRKIDAAVWTLPSVKSATNCAACHVGTERGLYEDEQLRLPAGLSAAQRRAWQD